MINRIPKRLQVVLLIALALLALKVIVFPVFEWQDETRAHVMKLQKNLGRLKNLETNRTQLETMQKEWTKRLDGVYDLFYNDMQSPEALQLEFQKELGQIASKSGISVQNTEWLYVNQTENILQTPIKMSFQANLDQFYDFLYRIEHHPLFFSVGIFQLTKAQGGRISGVVEVSAFSLKAGRPQKAGGNTDAENEKEPENKPEVKPEGAQRISPPPTAPQPAREGNT